MGEEERGIRKEGTMERRERREEGSKWERPHKVFGGLNEACGGSDLLMPIFLVTKQFFRSRRREIFFASLLCSKYFGWVEGWCLNSRGSDSRLRWFGSFLTSGVARIWCEGAQN